MAVPQAVLAGGWIPFVVVLVLALLFSWIYIRYFQHHELSEVSSTLTAVFALFVTLLTSALVPVDVFLVSFMKNADGSFKTWADDINSRQSIQNTVMYGYYALYGLVAFFIFVVLPFMYFYFEEKDEDVTTKTRCCSALKYSFVFMLVAVVILITGAFVPLKTPPKNATSIAAKFNYLKGELSAYSDGEKCVSILVGCLSVVGMLTIVMYTGYGMSALPLRMLSCCRPSGKDEEEPNARGLTKHERNEERARRLRAKASGGRSLTRWERRQLHQIEEEERLQRRIERREKRSRNSICGKLMRALKPFEVVFGIVFLLISLLIMTSLIITNIDKAEHSLGYKYGYTLPKPHLPNPINSIMVYAQKVFPLDYILFVGITIFFLFASMSGLKKMGIWCCFIKMYKIRAHRTMPQALLFMIFILMFMVISLNIMLFTIAPGYVTFGDQKYQKNVTETTHHNGTTTTWKMVSKACADDSPPELCLKSRLASLIFKLFYKAWIFGAFYYWAQWAFILVFFIGLIVSLVRCRKPVVYYESDIEDSDSDEERLLDT